MTGVPWPVELGLSVVCTGLGSVLFLVTYVMLWLLLCYKQKRFSYQSGLLFLCLLWAGCRTVLFSFYLSNCALTGHELLRPFPHWLLYSAPICLQFSSLCLLHVYYCQVIFKARCSPEFNRDKVRLHLGFVLLNLLFLTVNLTCILISNNSDDRRGWINVAQAVVCDFLFAACSSSLIKHSYKISRMPPAHVYLESKGSSGSKAVRNGIVIGLLYIVRAIYNLVMVCIQLKRHLSPFSFSLSAVYYHAVTEDSNDVEYLVFGLFVCFCEFVPMFLMVCFFSAKKLGQNLEAAGMVNSHSFGSRAYFFDNPRRYDSDEDLPRLARPRGERGSVSSSTPRSSGGWYGTICPTSSCALAPPLLRGPSSGAPIFFTCGENALA